MQSPDVRAPEAAAAASAPAPAPSGRMSPSGHRAPSGHIRRTYRRAQEQVAILRQLAAGDEATLTRAVAKVSRWSPAEHLAHVVLIDGAVLDRLERALAPPKPPESPASSESPPANPPPPGLNLTGRLVLGLGFIPRGAGRSPEPFHPHLTTLEALAGDLAAVNERLAGFAGALGTLDASRARYRHFIFGSMTAREWLRFLVVHHHHHLKIVRDILKRARSEARKEARREARAAARESAREAARKTRQARQGPSRGTGA